MSLSYGPPALSTERATEAIIGMAYTSSLVIGGTGMLAAATRWLAARSKTIIIVARRATNFPCHSAHAICLDADWDTPSFMSLVSQSLAKAPAPQTALLWLHEPRPVLSWLLPALGAARIVLVLGSMDGRPEEVRASQNLCSVRLGSIRTASGRRWLTNDEISRAAITSLEDGQSRVIGDLIAP